MHPGNMPFTLLVQPSGGVPDRPPFCPPARSAASPRLVRSRFAPCRAERHASAARSPAAPSHPDGAGKSPYAGLPRLWSLLTAATKPSARLKIPPVSSCALGLEGSRFAAVHRRCGLRPAACIFASLPSPAAPLPLSSAAPGRFRRRHLPHPLQGQRDLARADLRPERLAAPEANPAPVIRFRARLTPGR